MAAVQASNKALEERLKPSKAVAIFAKAAKAVMNPVPFFGDRSTYRMIRDAAHFPEPMTSILTILTRTSIYSSYASIAITLYDAVSKI